MILSSVSPSFRRWQGDGDVIVFTHGAWTFPANRITTHGNTSIRHFNIVMQYVHFVAQWPTTAPHLKIEAHWEGVQQLTQVRIAAAVIRLERVTHQDRLCFVGHFWMRQCLGRSLPAGKAWPCAAGTWGGWPPAGTWACRSSHQPLLHAYRESLGILGFALAYLAW